MLAEVGRLLVNLHGQHEAQTLLDADAQRAHPRRVRRRDGAGGSASRDAHDALARVRREIADARRRGAPTPSGAPTICATSCRRSRPRKLVDGEDERLEDEARRLEHAEELRSARRQAIVACIEGEEDAVLQRLGAVQRVAVDASSASIPSLARLQELFDTAFYRSRSWRASSSEYEASVELDPERLEEVRRRRDLLYPPHEEVRAARSPT